MAPLVSILATLFLISFAEAFVPPGRTTILQELSSRSYATASTTATATTTALRASTKWQVYVDQSKASLEKGGGATFDAFYGLAPPNVVTVHPAILIPSSSTGSGSSSGSNGSSSGSSSSSSSSTGKLKGPAVRCICTSPSSTPQKDSSFDVSNVDSVDKVVRVLQKHMGVDGVQSNVVQCLQWKYKGNGHLEAGQVTRAIAAYNQALNVLGENENTNNNDNDNSSSGDAQQEGTVLLMRATAHLQRAARHRDKLKAIVQDLAGQKSLERAAAVLHVLARTPSSLAPGLLRRLLDQTASGERLFRQTQYRHGLYQYALLQAAQDALRATELLPAYADSWKLVGEILSELWKLKESAQYLNKAVELDAARLEQPLSRVLRRLEQRQALLDQARAYGWSEDSLRLALDVAR